MNAELPIAFDGWGKMEVDLLNEETRLVIELDGGQHDDARAQDAQRTRVLEAAGIRYLGMPGNDDLYSIDAVIDEFPTSDEAKLAKNRLAEIR